MPVLKYVSHLTFHNRVTPGRRPVRQPWWHAWFRPLTPLYGGLPEWRGLLSPVGRFHQPLPSSQPWLPLWTGGPWRHQWTVWLWLWWPITSFGGQLDGEGERRSWWASRFRTFPLLPTKGGLEINFIWTNLCQKHRQGVVGKMFCVIIWLRSPKYYPDYKISKSPTNCTAHD